MEAYSGRQYVGIDLHRRRTVIVRTTASGEVLEAVRIVNDVQRLAAGDGPSRQLPGGGAGGHLRLVLGRGRVCRPVVPNVHLAHPLGVKAFEYRRVKTIFGMLRT